MTGSAVTGSDITATSARNLYDAQIFIDSGTNELVIQEAEGFDDRFSLYTAERYEITTDTDGNAIGSRARYIGSVVGEETAGPTGSLTTRRLPEPIFSS